MSARAEWRFRPGYKDFGRDFANPAWLVFEPSVRSIVREGTQNARDAALPGQGPAELIIRVHRVSGKRLDLFLSAMRWDELGMHIEASAAQPGKFGSILKRGLRAVNKGEIIAVTFNDFNTVGLIGSEEGSDELKGPGGEHFAALVRRSFDPQKGGSSGGSYGLGRNAALSGSLLRTAFYCSTLSKSYDDKSHNRFIGRTDLGARRVRNESYAGPGWFGSPYNDDAVISVWDDRELCKSLFLQRDPLRPDATGTSVLIPAFFDPSNERVRLEELCSEIARVVGTDFWPAIYDERLSVSVEAYDNDNRTDIIAVEPRSYRAQHVELYAALKDGTAGSEFSEETAIVRRDIEVDIPARKDDDGRIVLDAFTHRAILLVSRAEDASEDTNRVLGFRGPGMIVQERPYNIFSAIGPRFRAILLVGTAAELPPGGDVAEQFFSAAEPPSHDKWTHTAVGISEYYRGGKKALEALSSSVRGALADVLRSVKSFGSKGPDIILKDFRISDAGNPDEPPPPPPPPPTAVRVQRYTWEQRGNERLILVTVKKPRGSARVAPAVSCIFEDGGSTQVPVAAIYPANNAFLAEEGYIEVSGDEPTASFHLDLNWAAAELDPRYSVLSVSIAKQHVVSNA